MKTKCNLLILAVALLYSSCEKKDDQPSKTKMILGNWEVVGDNNQPAVVEWGLYYVGSVKFYSDNSFKIDLMDRIDTFKQKDGIWKFENNSDSIVFYSAVGINQQVFKDTTKFNVSFDSDSVMYLKNRWISIKHKKMKN